ncbi:hypothetical protein [Flammeovirga pacifica]|uniref:Outer membrane protein beta-barrel domain-containing protein n=1 Tax=Flammeovirga pacifica TaxID=915059 RepID=A0A1S1Z1F2_FLAPC|nr:hypothetical protein [Flammeovirga pacifica]OHX67071.1 hypothetical protein NH26_12325 [Flammeovirga pacifica]
MYKKFLITSILSLICVLFSYAQEDSIAITPPEEQVDASNPLSKGLNFYQIGRFKPNKVELQNIVNYTTNKWFIRAAVDYTKPYDDNVYYGSSSFMVSRIFDLAKNNDEWKVQTGFGVVVSNSKVNGNAIGVNFVGVQMNDKWKFVELFTYQSNGTIEAQYGAYYKFTQNGNWEIRTHPRMLFNTQTGVHEIPVGIGIGHTMRTPMFTTYIFCEPEYDLYNNEYLIYSGVKFIF